MPSETILLHLPIPAPGAVGCQVESLWVGVRVVHRQAVGASLQVQDIVSKERGHPRDLPPTS